MTEKRIRCPKIDKKEFINMTRQEAEHIKIHPLPILCRMETEEAG